MGRYIGPACRLCRREGEKLFLKGARCYTSKCAVERRASRPGQHGSGRKAFSEFGRQLREKQKVKRMYGLRESGFRRYFERALKIKGVTGTMLLQLLERRLDNVVYRLNFATSRRQARQMVRHGLILVDGKRVNVPGFLVNVGQVVGFSQGAAQSPLAQAAIAENQGQIVPEWLAIDRAAVQGTINALPSREQMPQGVNEQIVVELYSRN